MKYSPFTDFSIDISPKEFEIQVKDFFQETGFSSTLKEVVHDKKMKTTDQEYQIDVYYEFEHAGVSFKVLVECKKHKEAISREIIQVLNDKLSETGCHKGVLVSTSGFQKGAIAYAKRKGIALIRIIRGEMLYETKSTQPQTNLNEIKEFYGLPDFAYQLIEDEGNERFINVTLLEKEYKNRFFQEIVNVANRL